MTKQGKKKGCIDLASKFWFSITSLTTSASPCKNNLGVSHTL